MADETVAKLAKAARNPIELPLSTALAMLTALIYVSGYLIHSIYARSQGMGGIELVKSLYVETGLVFLSITACLVVVPYMIISIAGRKRAPGLEERSFMIWLLPVSAVNYLYVMGFFIFFITESDYRSQLHLGPLSFPFAWATPVYFVGMFMLIAVVPLIRYLEPKLNPRSWKFRRSTENYTEPRRLRLFVNMLRILGVSVSVFYDIVLCLNLKWIMALILSGFYYVVCLAVIVSGVTLVALWMHAIETPNKKTEENPEQKPEDTPEPTSAEAPHQTPEEALDQKSEPLASSPENRSYDPRIIRASAPFFLVLYIGLVTTYSFGVYRHIPMNRGGKYPLTLARLELKPNKTLVYGNLVRNRYKDTVMTGPVYIMEESAEYYYVIAADGLDWFGDDGPWIGLKKSEVVSIQHVQITNGIPRFRGVISEERRPFVPGDSNPVPIPQVR